MDIALLCWSGILQPSFCKGNAFLEGSYCISLQNLSDYPWLILLRIRNPPLIMTELSSSPVARSLTAIVMCQLLAQLLLQAVLMRNFLCHGRECYHVLWCSNHLVHCAYNIFPYAYTAPQYSSDTNICCCSDTGPCMVSDQCT